MATYHVTYINHLDEAGETFEYPTDFLESNGTGIESSDYVESDIRDGENFARETWEYEVDDDDTDRFENGLDRTPTVLSYRRVH